MYVSFGCLFFAFGCVCYDIGWCCVLSRVNLQVIAGLLLLLLIAEIRLNALLVLEYLLCQSLLLQKVLLSLVSHLVINLDLVFCHFDIFFDDADAFLLFGSLETEIVLIRSSLCCIAIVSVIVDVNLGLSSWAVVVDSLARYDTLLFFKLI